MIGRDEVLLNIALDDEPEPMPESVDNSATFRARLADGDDQGYTSAHCWTEWDTGTCPHDIDAELEAAEVAFVDELVEEARGVDVFGDRRHPATWSSLYRRLNGGG